MKSNFGISLAGVTAVTLLITTQASRADTITDSYIGADNHGYGDVIGNTSNFQINSLDAYIAGSVLHVSIDTMFAGKGDEGLFSGFSADGNGIGYGDLFLSSAWTPYGDAGSHYVNDDASNGTVWTYGYSLDNRYMSESDTGSGTLYSLDSSDNHTDLLMSDDFLSSGIFRNGQEVAVDRDANVTALSNNADWWLDGNTVNFEIDLANTALLSGSELALRWEFTCANDVIEGAIAVPQVPVPPAVWLFSSGLIGLTAVARRRNRKQGAAI
jgi:hypothetical protein